MLSIVMVCQGTLEGSRVMNNPELKIYTGAMWSQKSTKLLMEAERYKYQNKQIAVFKPEMDDRYSVTEVVTHMGWKLSAHPVRTGADVVKFLANSDVVYDVVIVDELFMIPGIADVLVWLYRNNVTVVAASLDLSATGKPFKEVEKILPWATYVKKCSAVCTVCGRPDAFYTHKKTNDENEISVGGAESYEPRCFKCHPIVNNTLPEFPIK